MTRRAIQLKVRAMRPSLADMCPSIVTAHVCSHPSAFGICQLVNTLDSALTWFQGI